LVKNIIWGGRESAKQNYSLGESIELELANARIRLDTKNTKKGGGDGLLAIVGPSE